MNETTERELRQRISAIELKLDGFDDVIADMKDTSAMIRTMTTELRAANERTEARVAALIRMADETITRATADTMFRKGVH